MRSARVNWVDIPEDKDNIETRRWVLQLTTLGQLGDDGIIDQLSHQFDLKSVRGNDSGVESLACVGIDENRVNVSYFLRCVGIAEGTLPEILSIYDFMEFVLLPHVTARIIADDMQILLEDTEEIRNQSIKFGQLVHWNLQDPAVLAVQDWLRTITVSAGFTARRTGTGPSRSASRLRTLRVGYGTGHLYPTQPVPYTGLPGNTGTVPVYGYGSTGRSPNDKSIVATKVSTSPQKEVELTLDDFPVRKHEKKAKESTAKAVQKPKSVKVQILDVQSARVLALNDHEISRIVVRQLRPNIVLRTVNRGPRVRTSSSHSQTHCLPKTLPILHPGVRCTTIAIIQRSLVSQLVSVVTF
ncbi:hypothetical protein B0H14DRAFT_3178191 [Mycena olivaceomarginata]|nr:hypothetical protein B0H14DRAFT_3178191 [Mycena olivaceomarginata]